MEFFEELKKHRENKKISLENISEKTRINLSYLQAIEEGNFDVLPNVYMRLFLISYCKHIDVDYQKTLENYEKYTKTSNMSLNTEFKNNIKNHPKTSNEKENTEDSMYDSNISIEKIIKGVIVIMIIITFFIIINTLQKNSKYELEQNNNSYGRLLKK